MLEAVLPEQFLYLCLTLVVPCSLVPLVVPCSPSCLGNCPAPDLYRTLATGDAMTFCFKNEKRVELVLCKCPAADIYKTLTKRVLLLKNLINSKFKKAG